MTRISFVALAVLAMSCGAAHAQIALPGAATESQNPTPAPSKADRPKSDKGKRREKSGLASSPRSIADKVLRLNGSQGQFLLSEHDKVLHIEKLSLSGEVISDPSRKCLIDIVADAPIETKSLGKPDGLDRFEAEIPACTFTFDVLDGAVLAPPQDRACVFQAADCQATPAGLWGPDPTTLHSDAKAIGRQRLRADAVAERTLRAIQTKLKGQPDADAITREDGDLAARRAEVCRDYVQEATYAFCASRMAQARAAYMKARLDSLKKKAPAEQD
jgi:hypothetical protein